MSILITEQKLDAISELGNMASGNAVTALSEMTGKRIDINVPYVKCIDIIDIPNLVMDKESLISGVYVTTEGDLKGYLTFIAGKQNLENLAKLAAGDFDIEVEPVISEIVNIINGSYLKALSDMLDTTINVSVPQLFSDMFGSILSSFAAELSMNSSKSIVISNNLYIDDVLFEAYYLFLLEEESLNNLIKKLEVLYNL